MTSVQKLYDLLKSLQTVLDQIATILHHERSAIINLNTADTEKYGAELTAFFSKIEPINQEIATTVETACNTASVVGEKSIAALATNLKKPERELLTNLQSAVYRKAEAVNNALAVNRNLLQDSLQFTSLSLQMFTNALRQTSSTTYGQQGRFIDAPEQPHIICKEI